MRLRICTQARSHGSAFLSQGNGKRPLSGSAALLLALTMLFTVRADAAGQPGGGGLTSAAVGVNLVAVLPPTLGLSISTLNLDMAVVDPAQGSAMMSVPVTSSWTLNKSISAVELVAYFESTANALAGDKGESIPSSRVLGGLNSESMFPFAETAQVGTPGAARMLYRQSIARSNIVGTREDQLHIRVAGVSDLGVPPGQYRGTLHLRLVAY